MIPCILRGGATVLAHSIEHGTTEIDPFFAANTPRTRIMKMSDVPFRTRSELKFSQESTHSA